MATVILRVAGPRSSEAAIAALGLRDPYCLGTRAIQDPGRVPTFLHPVAAEPLYGGVRGGLGASGAPQTSPIGRLSDLSLHSNPRL